MKIKSSLPAIVLAVILLILVFIDWTGCNRLNVNTSREYNSHSFQMPKKALSDHHLAESYLKMRPAKF